MNATLTESGPTPGKTLQLLDFSVGSFTPVIKVAPAQEDDYDLVLAAQHEHAMRQIPGFVA